MLPTAVPLRFPPHTHIYYYTTVEERHSLTAASHVAHGFKLWTAGVHACVYRQLLTAAHWSVQVQLQHVAAKSAVEIDWVSAQIWIEKGANDSATDSG